MNQPQAPDIPPSSCPSLDLKTGLAYGVGALTSAVTLSVRSFFQIFFLTSVAGLSGTRAGTILLVGRLLDLLSDPMIGWLSDRTRTRWGQRYPWMLGGMIPLIVSWLMLWRIPYLNADPNLNQELMFWYYILFNLIFDISLTAVILPYRAMTPELTQNYNERTRITSFQSIFSMTGGMIGLVIAQIIFSLNLPSPSKYFWLSCICSIFVVLSILICIVGTFHRTQSLKSYTKQTYVLNHPSFHQLFRAIPEALKNQAFLNVLGVEFFSWLAVQITAATLPYFVINYLRLSDYHVTQLAILVQIVAITVSILWSFLTWKLNKNLMYLLGIFPWILAQVALFFLEPTQAMRIYGFIPFVGIGIATANIVPYAMLPDVIDLNQAQTRERQEGIFYGLMNQAYKLSIGVGLFLVGLALDLTHFVTHDAQSITVQPDSALLAIRLAIGPALSIVLVIAAVLAYTYPITHKEHQRILNQIESMTAQDEPGDRGVIRN